MDEQTELRWLRRAKAVALFARKKNLNLVM